MCQNGCGRHQHGVRANWRYAPNTDSSNEGVSASLPGDGGSDRIGETHASPPPVYAPRSSPALGAKTRPVQLSVSHGVPGSNTE